MHASVCDICNPFSTCTHSSPPYTQDEWEALQVVQYKDRLVHEEHLLGITNREVSKYAVTSAKKKQ